MIVLRPIASSRLVNGVSKMLGRAMKGEGLAMLTRATFLYRLFIRSYPLGQVLETTEG